MKLISPAIMSKITYLLFLLSFNTFSFSEDANDYKLGSGDTIKIIVFGQVDLSIETLLNDSGKVNYPFLGQLQATGKTLDEFQQLIHLGLKGDYLINPNVSVSIVEYRPFFIDGEVKLPGGYPFQPGLTINKAAALAGGYTERASLSKIFIIRSNDAAQKSVSVNANTNVMPGDIITVKQSYF
jgi:polysaccharide export outer membrane protein